MKIYQSQSLLRRAAGRVIESLESRRLLDATVDGQTFGIRGTTGDDVISVTLNETAATVVINGVPTNLVVDPGLRMRVFLDAGDDQLSVDLIGRSIPATLYGGGGDDSIEFLALDERLLIFGEGGNDSVNLQRSAPTTPTSLSVTIYGGSGNDFVEGSPATDYIFGDGGADTLAGNGQQDRILGGGGNDSLGGGADRDTIRGENGNDGISGGADNDSLEGNGGDDNVAGNDGNDRVGGGDGIDDGAGNDTIVGGAGNDSMWDGQGSDLLIFGPGNDSHFANQSEIGDSDTIYGNGGDDSLGSDNNTSTIFIDCGDGDDRVFGRGRAHTILGGAGNDVLRGSFGAPDSIDGGTGDDYIAGEFGGNAQDPTADTLLGGIGRDEFFLDEFAAGEVKDYTHTEDVDPYLAVVLEPATANFSGVLRITGNSGPDRVIIEPDPSDSDFFRVITKETRNATPVTARFANNQLGSLIVNLGSGNDSLQIEDVTFASSASETVNILPGAGDDYARFDGEAFGLRFEGGGGDDHFDNNFERGGKKILYGGPGNDTLFGGKSNDLLDGGGGNDVLAGFGRADNIKGGDGDDEIDGGKGAGSLDGADTLEGGFGRDTVAGYVGVDRIFGFVETFFGDGNDSPNTFEATEAMGLEVRDYREGVDVIV